MRHLRTVLPALATAVAVGIGGTAFALAGAGPATSAGAPAAAGPVSDLLAGSYQADFARLSVGGKARISSKQAPVLSGRAKVGSTLTVSKGTWKPAQVRLTYTWYADSARIRGASGASYTPVPGVVGDEITVEVTASKQDYRPASVVRKAGKVAPGSLSVVTDPVVRGDAAVGETLRVTPGRWSPEDVALSYVWLKGRKVLGTGKRYTVQRTDRGAKLRVEVTATRPGYRTEAVVTDATDAVRR